VILITNLELQNLVKNLKLPEYVKITNYHIELLFYKASKQFYPVNFKKP
jgi:hypothetical protein